MNMHRCQIILALIVLFGAAANVSAQNRGARQPQVGYVYPAGGQVGKHFEVNLGGQFLNGAKRAVFSGEGIRGTVIKYDKPLRGKELAEIREILQKARKQLQEDRKKRKTPGQPRPLEIVDLAIKLGADREKLEAFKKFRQERNDPKHQPNPQLSETVTLRVEIDADAKPGRRELRLLTNVGLTNPLRFDVGRLSEHNENEPNNRDVGNPISGSLPTVINGQITPGDVDRFSFNARQGQRIVVAVSARELTPYLADAVPGWFQATAALFDSEGREVAFIDDFRFHPDPVLCYKIPKNGRYTLEIHDAIYRGREDFVYRVTLGEIPFITSVFPMGTTVDSTTNIKLAGWNLTKKQMTLDTKTQTPGIELISADRGRRLSNRVCFALDTLAECNEIEPNGSIAKSQKLQPPIIVNGRIDQSGDIDVFRFHGRKGGQIVVEVIARRLGSPLDSLVCLADSKGRRLTSCDDCDDPADGLSTHHADSRFLFTLPHSGDFDILLADAQNHGGPDYAYRLRVSALRPDFELRVIPSTINAQPGSCVPIIIHALRKDGFDGPISLALDDPPDGFFLSGGLIPAGQDKIRLTLTVSGEKNADPFRLELKGSASIHDRTVSHRATPADDVMQAFIYRHLVPADDWMVALSNRPWRGPRWRNATDQPVSVPIGSTGRAPFNVGHRLPVDRFKFALNDPPPGISIDGVETAKHGFAIVLRADREKIKPGDQGNVIVDVFVERAARNKKSGKPGKKQRFKITTLPAISYKIVPAEVANR